MNPRKPTHDYKMREFLEMVEDSVRVSAFARALERLAPGKFVLEIGGGFGFFACLAARAGARRVVSVDYNPAILQAEKFAQANGLGGKIEFQQILSTDLELTEKADLLLCDLKGSLPLYDGSWETIADARRRLLLPDPIQVPGRDRVFVGLLHRPVPQSVEGLLMNAVAPILAKERPRLRQGILTHQPFEIADLTYQSETCPVFESETEFVLQEDTNSPGVALWFESELCEDISLSTNPFLPDGQRATIYGTVYHAWSHSSTLEAGVSYTLHSQLCSKNGLRLEIRKGESSVCSLGGKFSASPIALTARASITPKVLQTQELCRSIQEESEIGEILESLEDRGLNSAQAHKELVETLLFLQSSLSTNYSELNLGKTESLLTLKCAGEWEDFLRGELSSHWSLFEESSERVMQFDEVAVPSGTKFALTLPGKSQELYEDENLALERIRSFLTQL